MKLYIYPYSSGSESAKLLAERLGAKRIRLQNSEYVHKEGNLVINWGNSNCPHPCLNSPSTLRETVDKLSCFRLLTRLGLDHYLPRYWTNPSDIPSGAFPVYCRTTTTGCDGAGIVVAEGRDSLVPASLYTARIPTGTEYRVTYFKGYGVTDIQTKLPRAGVEPDPYIKTYDNGWGFQRKPVVDITRDILTNAVEEVIEATGLDFAGFDIVVTTDNRVYLLEINSAMGLEGDALEKFAQAVEWYVQKTTPAPEKASEPPAEDIEDDELLVAIRDERWLDVAHIAIALHKGCNA